MKKTVLSIVVAGALLVSGPLASSAEHYSGTKNTYETRYTVTVNNSTNWNELIQSLFKKYYTQNYQTQLKVEQPTQPVEQPTKETTQTQPTEPQQTVQPVQESPVVQQPVQQQPKETTNETTNQATYALSQYEQQVVTLTNNERAKYGLQPLKVDLKVSEVARLKSSDMKKNGYFSHTSPTYGSPFDMMKQFGVQYRAAGENIAMGQRSPQEVVNAWMNSEGHRKNILSSNFTHIGVGHVEGNYWTQMFIGK
ncbi:sporulation protein [Bacillus luteolus]|uniref:Sporulation protein n=1 Tax=Litchfieldia luteola TaxID=682179 RepID=A0ABR9QGP5_9BACI|nr:CAP domain-containing protein [Cytobacillus luteolus]MBE4907673.1 sporulation protein [Cytobacillus luteolus]MBP1941124.1 putative YkwD family protein [Cytobacillus luteolus]